MQNQVISETLLDKREEWQNNTITEMQEKLNSHPAGRYLVADYKKSLVVVYGNSQIGKTSLILNMMGIKSEYRDKVYSVLRAHQEYGESSTVTAIIYMISPTDNYGMSFSTDDSKDIIFCSESEMSNKLYDLRKCIETGDGKDQILYLFIPRCYFGDEILEKDSFSIMDLPGINSKNELEKDHVDSVVSRYMSLATVKMIVTKGDSIQDLASIEVPEGIDWRAFPNKYFVVVTMAFSQGSVKNYFNIEKGKREKSFKEYVKDSYSEISQIVSSLDMEWYPIDVGESFHNLIKTYQDDSNEIVETQNFFMEEIRNAITQRKGNGLRNIIDDLKSYSKDYYRVNISTLKKIIEDRQEDLKQKKSRLTKVGEEKEQYENALAGFTIQEINSFRELEQLSLHHFWDDLTDKIEKFISSIAESYPARIKDHNLEILKRYREFVKATLVSCDDIKKYVGDKIFNDLYPEGIADILNSELKDILDEQKLELTNLFRPKGVSFFFSKVDRTDVVSKLLSLSEVWKNIIIEKINNDIKRVLQDTNSEKEKYFQISQLLEYKKNEESKLVLEIKILEEGLIENQKDLNVWEKKEKADSALLATYYDVARQEYLDCKSKIINEMQGCSMSRKLQYMMLLGLMEQDYNAIVEGE